MYGHLLEVDGLVGVLEDLQDSQDFPEQDLGEEQEEDSSGGGNMPWWPGWGRGWRWCFWATGMPGWMRWGYPGYGYGFPSFAPSEEDE